ncbi:uncharacterized protein BT62DRAFT_1010948 [Guyanagaster necrorhizus]|uniref:Uncharacterized protein n=1 Tax=Guyanagaster necrorhizus TaxID=856835 RepID=A0A9P8ANN1_9AGAR|nr:uncharacterized protein BT62DRAFT_1010948 [Guyanagaster necrorhizus MCA 3950]KAG7441921.1 hypothetical protein BT62DRAFT_1010948 [Guyanagaster necrorhizus MCA 3950]
MISGLSVAVLTTMDGDLLRRFLLGISAGACTILKKIFRLEPHSRISLADRQREITELKTFFSNESSSDSSSHNSPVLQRSISSLGSTPPSEIGAMRIDDTDVLLVTRSIIEAGVTGDDSLALDLRAIHLVGVDRPVSAPAVAIHPVMSSRSIASSVDSDGPIAPETHPVHVDVSEVPDMEEGEGIGEMNIALVVKDDENDIQPADLADDAETSCVLE